MTSTKKEEQITVAKRMKKLCQTDNNAREAATFIQDAVTLMELVLKDESVHRSDIATVALRLRKQRNSGLMPCLFWTDLDTLLDLILGKKCNE